MALTLKAKPKIGRPPLEQQQVEQGEGEGFPSLPAADVLFNRKTYPDPREEFEELRVALIIDKNTLDEDVIQQPVLYQKVSEEYTYACSERDAAKEGLLGLDAKLAHELRSKYAQDTERVTDKRITEEVQAHPRHIVHYQYLSSLIRRAAYLGALRDSFDQRGKMLRELSSLFVAGYFSRVVSTGASRNVGAADSEAAREVMRQLRDPLSRKGR
jgi:hypothetical protein